MLYIVIPVFNRINLTLDCLESLSRQTYKNFVTIVVNDGSTDQTSSIIAAKYPEVTVLEGGGDLWWSASMNLGIEYVLSLSPQDDDLILTLNNDLVVKENYLQEMIAASERFPDTLIGSVSVDIAQPESIHYCGTLWNSRTATYRRATEHVTLSELAQLDKLLPTSLLPGRGTLIAISIFRKIGLYDHSAFPQYMGDDDFSLRAKNQGFKLGVSPRAVVYSHIHDTGLGNRKRNLRYYFDFYTSLKSRGNLFRRWRWAQRHAKVPAMLYFTLDVARLTMGVFRR